MEDFWGTLIIISIVGLPVCLILSVVKKLRKRPAKKTLGAAGVFAVVFVIAVIAFPVPQEEPDRAAAQPPVQLETPSGGTADGAQGDTGDKAPEDSAAGASGGMAFPDYGEYQNLIDRTAMTLGISNYGEGNSGGTVGNWNNYALQPDGSLWTWKASGGFGYDGSGLYREVRNIKLMDDVAAFSAHSGAEVYTLLAVKKDGSLWLLAPEEHAGPAVSDPVLIMDHVTAAAAGNGAVQPVMAVDENGGLWVWEVSSDSQQGPVKVLENTASVVTDMGTAMAIQTDGSLWAWGVNVVGEVGDGTQKARDRPVKVMEDVVAASVAGIGLRSMALRSDGSLWAWGSNGGTLGDGTTENRVRPVKVLDDVTSFSFGCDFMPDFGFTLAVRSDNTLWGWGKNNYGQLGNGTRQDSAEPVHIMDGIAYAAAFDEQYAIAVGTDGSIWCWGKGAAQLTPEWSGAQEESLYVPVRVDLSNLPLRENEPDWLAVGTGGYFGIAGVPAGWTVNGHSYLQEVTGTEALCLYEVSSADGKTAAEIGIFGEGELSDLFWREDTDNLTYAPFVFNDGNTGLLVQDEQNGRSVWINGSAIMSSSFYDFDMLSMQNFDNPDYDGNIVIEIARTLHDSSRANSAFLDSVSAKLAELGV